MSYADVWPATGFRDEEVERLRKRGEVVLGPTVSIGEIGDVMAELELDWCDVEFDDVQAIGGVATLLRVINR